MSQSVVGIVIRSYWGFTVFSGPDKIDPFALGTPNGIDMCGAMESIKSIYIYSVLYCIKNYTLL